MDAIAAFADHVVNTGFDDLPPDAVRAARVYILDSIGVGTVGSAGPWVDELVESLKLWGEGAQSRIWVRGDRLPAPSAALCNAYQIHNSEYDFVHERAVVHPMAVLLAATLAYAERQGGVAGRDLVAAVTLGVDVACHLGVASRSSMRFFRPATAGAMGATAAIGKLMGFDAPRLVNAFGIAYGQMCGTMQAHTEGSFLLGMQIGFNARNAVVACDMAARGLIGPQNILEGPFGYFNLFEPEHALPEVLAEVGKVWRITEVAHKPWPTGRASHGLIDGILEMQRADGFEAGDVDAVVCRAPPLTYRLVSRPIKPDMTVNYARLSAPYVMARAIQGGDVSISDFTPAAVRDEATLALGRRIAVELEDTPDPNTLLPVTVELRLKTGRERAVTLDTVYGNPAKPMSREAQLGKFRRNWTSGSRPLAEANGERLIALVDDLEAVSDVRELAALLS